MWLISLIKPSRQRLSVLLFSTMWISALHAVPVVRVDVGSKPPHETGTELGRQIQAAFPDLGAKYDAYLATRMPAEGFSATLKRTQALKSALPPAYRQEIDSLAAVLASTSEDKLGDAALSVNEFWALQTFFDRGERAKHTESSGFGVFKAGAGGHGPLVGRNVSWPAELDSLQAITVYQYPEYVVANIGLAGYSGVLSGFNDRGLFAAHVAVPADNPAAGNTVGLSPAFVLRELLEQAGSVSQAFRLLEHYPDHSAHNLLLADRRTVRVIERMPGAPPKLRHDRSALHTEMYWDQPGHIAVVNCFVSKTAPLPCQSVKSRARWSQFRKQAAQPIDLQAMRDIMLDQSGGPYQSILAASTRQSMVFVPGKRQLFLYTAPDTHPAHPVMQPVSGLVPPDTGVSSFFMQVSVVIILLGMILVIPVIAKIKWHNR